MPISSVIANGMKTTSSNVPRLNPSGGAASLSRLPSPSPGKKPTSEANSAQNVVRQPQIHTPAIPNGTLYGRYTCPCEYRSLISVGKMARYDTVVNSSTTLSTALKYFSASPPESWKARTITIVETVPDRKLTTIGVPYLAENVPRMRGPPPS